MKVTSIDRHTCKAIQDEAEKALQAVAEKFGLAVKQAGGGYEPTLFKAKFEFAVIGENGKPETQEKNDFLRWCGIFGLKADDLGRTFKNNGQTFRVIGLKPGSPKYPIIGEQLGTQRRCKFPAESIVAKLHPETLSSYDKQRVSP